MAKSSERLIEFPNCSFKLLKYVFTLFNKNTYFNINYVLALARPRGVSVAYHRSSAEVKVWEQLFSVLSRKVTDPVSRKSNLTFKIHDFGILKMGYEYKLRCKSHFRDPAGLRPVLAVRVDI